jgi:hypothetical protein
MSDEAKAALQLDSSAETGNAESKLHFTGQNIIRLLQQAANLAATAGTLLRLPRGCRISFGLFKRGLRNWKLASQS